MLRNEIIKALISKFRYQSYLEIGVCNGDCFETINCVKKVGVDPADTSPATYKVTSDEFFDKNLLNYELVFIDGLHHSEQVFKDITNALEVIPKYGTIVCHDMNPIEEIHQRVPRESKHWNGDCWKAWAKMRSIFNHLEMFVVDTDNGVGIIRYGKQKLLKLNKMKLDYDYLNENREEGLHLQRVDYFRQSLS